ncbi:MAG TPA: bifunctional precorrin-2 dehydrogenase/sirohydrochlorin ferrochelatase [Desulfatiglandales bacterium]|nr:bifunctional precorrin-2 dehydrogenase/sirohydrochlorin ferrochelatase [Desulfatiglandales bacterium]
MPYYPVFLDLKDKKVLVIGGGKVAERKIKNLLTYGCSIYIISKNLTPALKRLVSENKVENIPYESLETFMDDAFMVIAATDNPEINTGVALQARERGILVNAVDQPQDCNFIMPSIVRQGALQIAISTSGKSPALAKKIRKEMGKLFGPEYGLLLELLGLIRVKLISHEQASKNKITFQKLVDSGLLEMIKKGNLDKVRGTLVAILGENFPVDDVVNQLVRNK